MPHQVTMPLLGLTMEEGTITEWLKKEGETVAKEEPLFIVETDKSAVEVGAPAAGVLSQIIVQVGQTAAVSAPIAVICAAWMFSRVMKSSSDAITSSPVSSPTT